MKQKYADFDDAIQAFIKSNCLVAVTDNWDDLTPPYADCEIRIKLNGNGGGYIHLLNQDSDTIEFATMNHYKSNKIQKPKHLK